MNKFLTAAYYLCDFVSRAFTKFVTTPIRCRLFKKCGKNISVGTHCKMNYSNITLGDSVSIGRNAEFICTRAQIIIGDHVMFGPHVFMITGGHRMDIRDRFMDEITNAEKRPEDDRDIVVCGDNWIGVSSQVKCTLFRQQMHTFSAPVF